jgi:outer membrane murein-binding lipoprotein Lpp
MSEEKQQITQEASGAPRWLILAVLVPTVIAVWALWSNFEAARSSRAAEQNVSTQVKTLTANVDQLKQQLTVSEQSRAQTESQLATVNEKVQKTQGVVGSERKQSKELRTQYSKQFSDIQDDVKSVKGELATKASGDDVKALTGNVNGVRTDLDATKQNLQLARSDMGTLIARNHEEIDQLRRMGQRDYFEFTLNHKGDRQKVGDVTLELRDTNTKKNLYSLKLGVDDTTFEKKNRSVNEPIFFYTRGSRSSLELVVNQVGKNKAVGYISIPKSKSGPTAGK